MATSENTEELEVAVELQVKPKGRIWWSKLPVAPNNGDRHFSKLFNVEETKGIIHSRIYPARDVVQSVWYKYISIDQVQFYH